MQSESMHICLSYKSFPVLDCNVGCAHPAAAGHALRSTEMLCGSCSEADGDLHMAPARLQQIADGSQRDEPMVPQAKQSLSHPASHPLHMTTASRE